MTTETTHFGPSPYHPGDTLHRGLRENCPGCDQPDTTRRGGRQPTPHGQLTHYETRVVAELARGGTYRQIARTLGVSESSIRNAVQRALGRLDANDRPHLVARAIGLRLIPAGIALTPTDREVTR